MMNRRARYCLFVVLGALLLNVALCLWPLRVDVTSERRFSLSEETLHVLSELERPVRVDIYRSRSVTGIPPVLQSHGDYVEGVLREYSRHSHGRLQVVKHDPAVGTAAEESAMKSGMIFEELRSGDATSRFCLGVCFSTLGRTDVSLRQLIPGAVNSLEYELTRALCQLIRTRQTRVAVLSSLPLFGGIDLETRQQRPEWKLVQALKENNYEVVDLGGSLDALGTGFDILLMVHPPELDLATLKLVDEFIMGGGRLLAFLDSGCWSAMRYHQDGHVSSSDLPGLLQAWGIDFDQANTVLDKELATIVLNRQSVPENHIEWLTLKQGQMSATDALTSQLSRVEVFHAGSFTWKPTDGIQVTEILHSSEHAQLMPAQLAFRPQHFLEREFKKGNTVKCLGISVEGRLKSAFGSDEVEHGRAILVGDADCLHDSFTVGRKTDNLQLVLNCLDRLRREGEGLLALRNRSYVNRRLDLLHQRLEEDSRAFQKQLDEFQRERQKLEHDIATLEEHRLEGILTDAEGEALRQNYESILKADRKLRGMQAEAGKKRESYRQAIIFWNILLGPVLVVLVLLWSPFLKLWKQDWRRGLQWSAGILAVVLVLGGLCLWGHCTGNRDREIKTEPLLQEKLSRDRLQSIELKHGDNLFHLDRQESGMWLLREKFAYPANLSFVNELTAGLNVCRGVPVKLSDEELSLAGVSPAKGWRIRFSGKDMPDLEVRMGIWKRNYANEAQGRYLRLGNRVLLSNHTFQLVGTPMSYWLDMRLPGFSKDAKRISRESEFKELRWSLEARPGGYEVQGRIPRHMRVQAPVVKNIVDNFRYLRVLDVAQKVQDFKQQLRLQVIGSDDLLYEYVFGTDADGRWYGRLDRVDGVVPEDAKRRILEHYGAVYMEVNGRLASAFLRKRLDLYAYSR